MERRRRRVERNEGFYRAGIPQLCAVVVHPTGTPNENA